MEVVLLQSVRTLLCLIRILHLLHLQTRNLLHYMYLLSVEVSELSLISPAPMDIHQDSNSTASMAVSQGPITCRFFRASRGRCLPTSVPGIAANLNQPTKASAITSLSDVNILGESPLRPPPQV
jgi:hypothetical protein